jgi:hypothetical protein
MAATVGTLDAAIAPQRAKNSFQNSCTPARSSWISAGTSTPAENMPWAPESTTPRAPFEGASTIASRSARTSCMSNALTGARAMRISWMPPSWGRMSSMGACPSGI